MKSFEDEFGLDEKVPGKPLVVIVDDDPMILSSLKVVLGSRYEVETYEDPIKGALAGARPQVSLVIIDIKMPKHDGFWVFTRIRSNMSQVPIIFNSAYQDLKVPEELASMYKSFAFLSKNGDIGSFLKAVDAAIKGAIDE